MASRFGKVPKQRHRAAPIPTIDRKSGFASGRNVRSSNDQKSSAGRSQGFQFNHGLGQHILKNPLVIKTMIEKAGIQPTDTVLEIGPGTGNLTMKLLEVCKKVVAVEFDPRMVAELTKRCKMSEHGHKLQIIHGDFLKVTLPFFDLCVANVPYQISSPLVFKLLAHRPQFRVALLMFQREFALRMIAKPNSDAFSRLSLNCQLLAKCSHLMKVGKNCFRPPPKVESSVIRMEPRIPPPPIDFLEWDGLLRIVFQRKNKTIRSVFNNKHVLELMTKNYKTYLALNSGPNSMQDSTISVDEVKQKILQLLDESGMGNERSSKLTQSEFLALLELFNRNGFHFKS